MANEFKVRKGLLVEASGSTSGSTLVDVQGTVGQVFSITDNLIGSIFSVNDISGIPLLDVNSNGTVIGGISTTTPTASIQEGVSSVYGDMADWDTHYASGEILKNQELNEACSWGHCLALQNGLVWILADPSQEALSKTMLGIALGAGSSGDTVDILIKGFVESSDFIADGNMRNGNPVYLREGGTGRYTGDVPTTSGTIVRLIGYAYQRTGTNNNSVFVMRFDPDNTWVEL